LDGYIPGIVPGVKFPSGAALSVNGNPTPHGLFTPPPANGFSFLSFLLARKAESISFEVGLDDGSPNRIVTQPVFQVWGDNKLLWASPAIAGKAQTVKCENLKVDGVRTLVLKVMCPGKKEGVEPVWYEPTVTWK
jgi:hypothetical protein